MDRKYEQPIKKIVKDLSKNKKVYSIFLFWSYLKNFGNLSDIDICIIGKLNENEKKKILRDSPEKFDISFFEELPIFIKVRVFKDGKELFVRNKNKIEEIKSNTLKEYREFMFFMKNRMTEKFENA